ncbi:MAG TPA: ABC transporter substrate-binding protein [Terriglobales bacterium]|nr:ABC transporter substrate-binding protein [Terriglobales bacterium]
MKRFGWQLVAASSVLVSLAYGATRPQYGGTAHVLLRNAPNSLDPASPQSEPFSAGNLFRLLYDTLTTVDDNGRVQPGLALSWQTSFDHHHWYFQLRPGVKFDDGSPLTADSVAASLRQVNTWTVAPQGDSISISLEQVDDFLPAKLALPWNAIAKRGEANPRGTGPFRVAEWTPGKRLLLTANEEYWAGRPFLNSVEVQFNMTYRDQEVALELGRADMVEVAPEQASRMQAAGRHLTESQPMELLALVFARDSQSNNESRLRDALRLCIDRRAIRDGLLGGDGESVGGLIPNWIGGYEFLFPSDANVTQAQENRGAVNQAPMWTLGYNPADPLSQVIAERIALNARDVGLRVQLSAGSNADVQLVRVRLQSVDEGVALKTLAAQLALAEPKLDNASVQALYQSENSLLQTQRIIPLFHIPVIYGLGPNLKGWNPRRDGGWRLTDVWMTGTRISTD